MRRKLTSLTTYLAKLLVLAIIYHLTARLGLKMAYVQPNTSPVWPPTGITIAALLLFGYQLWPGISLGVLLGSILTGAPIKLALGMTVGNTLEALAVVIYLKRFVDFHLEINRVQDVINLLVSAFFGTMISATIGTLTLMLTGFGEWEYFQAIWITWWVGDLLGALVVAPVLLVWISAPPIIANWRSYIEGAIQLSLLAFITWYVFSNQPPVGILHQALLYVVFPFTIWAALRFGQQGATAAIFLVSGIAIWGTAGGMGPFSSESKNDSLVLLQTFLGVVSLTMLILSAATVERRKAVEALHQRVDDLATLSDSSRTFLDTFKSARLYKTICRFAVERLRLEVVWIEIADNATPLAAVHGVAPHKLPALKSIWEDGEDDWYQKNQRIKTIEDLADYDEIYQSYAVFPLIFGDKVIGLLKILSKEKLSVNDERLRLIQSYANLAAVAMQNTWLFGEVQASNKQLHALSQRLMKAQEEERLHLSREIHDESGQLLSALSVQLGLLERDSGDPELVKNRIAELKTTTKEIQDNLHHLAVNLRPASLDHLGLVTALQQYVEEFNRQYGIIVEFETIGIQDKRLRQDVETALFRVVQESLTNVALHAKAKRVDVLINIRDKQIVAVIEDDGIGFVPVSSSIESHLGIFGMRERVEMLGGKLTIESSPGEGTTVNVEVPYDD